MNRVWENSDGKLIFFISVECPPGFTGMDCIYKCIYPTYGEDCFRTCECSNDTCDFVSGCKVTSTTGIHSCSQISLLSLLGPLKKNLYNFPKSMHQYYMDLLGLKFQLIQLHYGLTKDLKKMSIVDCICCI